MAGTFEMLILFGTRAELEARKGEVGVTARTVCALLDISEARLRQIVADGGLAARSRIGSVQVFFESDVRKLIGKRGK
jgi:hypothetical protein